MARTVADAVAVFDVIAGTDSADPVTAPAQGRRPDSYLNSLDKEGLKGARVGVVRQGAEIVEGVNIAEIDQIPPSKLACDRFKYDINAYLAHLGPPAPKSLDDIIASQKFHPSILKYLLDSQAEAPPDQNPQCQAAAVNRPRLAEGLGRRASRGAR